MMRACHAHKSVICTSTTSTLPCSSGANHIPDTPPILFAHATGFHARVWDQVIAHLPDYHCFALDLRGHGRSGKANSALRLVACSVRMSQPSVQALGLRAARSESGIRLGGHAVTLAASFKPNLFATPAADRPGDPALEDYYVGVVEFDHFTARRRREWASPDEMFDRFKDRPPFNPSGSLTRCAITSTTVCCPIHPATVTSSPARPAFEAESYNYSSAANIYPEIASIRVPVTILRAAGALGYQRLQPERFAHRARSGAALSQRRRRAALAVFTLHPDGSAQTGRRLRPPSRRVGHIGTPHKLEKA